MPMILNVICEGFCYLPEMLGWLMDWTCHALDYDKALCQEQPVFKIRHLKAGIKLATTLFSSDSSIVKKLCVSDILHPVV